MASWVEDTIVVCVPVTLEYDPARVGRDYLVAEAERGLTHSLQHIAGHYRIEGGKAAEAGFAGPSYEKGNAKRGITDMGGAWIPVSERLPAWGQHVIVAYRVACPPPERQVSAECYYDNGVWTGCDKMKRGQPTHWMPLPEPPGDICKKNA